MSFNRFKNKFKIESARLKDYDYSSNGYYAVTICTHNRIMNFGEIRDNVMHYSRIGEAARNCWIDIEKHFPFVKLDVFIIMPNHVHGLLFINKDDNDISSNGEINKIAEAGVETQDFASLQLPTKTSNKNKFGPQSNNLASIIRGYKIGVTKIAKEIDMNFKWQSRFYDSIIKSENHLYKVREYISNNVINWQDDDVNPINKLL